MQVKVDHLTGSNQVHGEATRSHEPPYPIGDAIGLDYPPAHQHVFGRFTGSTDGDLPGMDCSCLPVLNMQGEAMLHCVSEADCVRLLALSGPTRSSGRCVCGVSDGSRGGCIGRRGNA